MAVESIISLKDVLRNKRMEAEFYKPDVLRYLNKKIKWEKIGSILSYVQYGSSLPLNEEGEGYKIFRLNEIEDCFLTKPEKWIVISDRKYKSLRLLKNDVLFCRTNGNIKYVGRTGILKEDIDVAFASYLVRVRTNKEKILPEYLTVYLNTNVGRAFIERQAMHSNQFNVSADQLKKIPIPLFDLDFQEKIAKFVNEAASLRQKSNRLFKEAEKALLEELGIINFAPNYKNSYSSTLSNAFGVNRFNAEYFQPAYDDIIDKIMKYSNGYTNLLNLAKNIKPNFSPIKYPDKLFYYIELADIETFIGVIRTVSEIRGDEAPSRARRVLKENDLIVSSVEGSLEKVALVNKDNEGSLASTGFFQFRVHNILPEVLLVLFKSIILLSQLKRECSGTILTAVPNESLKRVIIPTIPDKIQKKIASNVVQSHEARSKAKRLLEEAKKRVEIKIEKAEKI